MPDRLRLRSLCVSAVIAVLLAPAAAWSGPASGHSVDTKDLRARLKAVEAHTPVTAAKPADVAALRAELGLGASAGTLVPTTEQTISGAGGLFSLPSARTAHAPVIAQSGPGHGPVDVSTTNFRLMLATLSQTYSGVNNLSLITAQGPRGAKALSVRSGDVTLADLKFYAAANGFEPRADGTLTAPVVLWPDATLRLAPGERLAMARDTGAFLISMGRIEATGATIESQGPENPHEPGFVPFVTVVGGGSIKLVGATLRHLGFGSTNKFAGLTVAGNALMVAELQTEIRDTLFDQLKSVSLAGTRGALITGNTFQNARNAGLVLVNAPDAKVNGNLFHGLAPTNAIRVELGSDNALVSQNVFLEGNRAAVLVSGPNEHVTVRDNLVWGRDGAGIKFLRSDCGLAQGNILIDNHQKGIEVRKSDGVVVQDNVLAGNRSSGIWVSAQESGAQTVVHSNFFERNGAGLSTATGAEVWIEGNDLALQTPKLLDGDIAKLTNAVVRKLRGTGPIRFAKGQAQPQTALIDVCGGNT